MRIVYIIKSLAQIAGTERIITDRLNYLAENNNDVFIITYEQGLHPLAFKLEKDIKFIDLDCRFFTLYKYNIFTRYIKYTLLKNEMRKKLQKVIDEIKPDIICTTVYSIRISDIFFKIKTDAALVLEAHANLESLYKTIDYQNNLLYILAKLLDYKIFSNVKKFSALVTLSKKDENDWSRYINNRYYIPNSITFYPPSIKREKSAYKRIICVGRLEYEKGFDLLINAYHKIANNHLDWRIDIFGEGKEKEKLQGLINKLQLNKFIYIHPPTINIYSEYLKSDILVLSSRHEGFGLVLAEAMSCGLACISFDCPSGPREIITDNDNGLLVKNGDINDLASKIEWMIIHEKEREIMGLHARESAKRFDKNIVMQKWIYLFTLLKNRNSI